MSNPNDLTYRVKQQQAAMLREASLQRMARLYRQHELAARPMSLKQRLGQQLVNLGQRLVKSPAAALD